MAPEPPESPPSLAGRLRRVGEMLIGLSGSPVPTHLFQTLAEQAQAVVPHDYLAVCLEDAEQQGYLVHSLSGLPGEAVAGSSARTRDSRGGPSAPDAPTWSRSSIRSRTPQPISTACWS